VQQQVLIPSFTTIDMSVAFADKSDRYRLTIIGRNLTDENFAALITRGGPANGRRLQVPREADRYFGAQFRVGFGGAADGGRPRRPDADCPIIRRRPPRGGLCCHWVPSRRASRRMKSLLIGIVRALGRVNGPVALAAATSPARCSP